MYIIGKKNDEKSDTVSLRGAMIILLLVVYS